MTIVRRVITNGGSYDSELGHPSLSDNGSILTLVVKIHLFQITPRGNRANGKFRDSGERFSIDRWTEREWGRYRSRFEDMAELLWNHRLYLTPPATLPSKVLSNLMAPGPNANTLLAYIRCHLDVRIVSKRQHSHASLGIYRLSDAEKKGFRSFIGTSSGRDTGRLSNRDTQLESTDQSGAYSTVAHEVGHILGLDHPVCRGNAPRCYGEKNTKAGESILGGGIGMLEKFARPWARRIGAHVGHRGRWKATLTKPNSGPGAWVIKSGL